MALGQRTSGRGKGAATFASDASASLARSQCARPTRRARAMADSRYNFSLTTFDKSGRLGQIDHALKAVENGETSLGIRGEQRLRKERRAKAPTRHGAASGPSRVAGELATCDRATLAAWGCCLVCPRPPCAPCMPLVLLRSSCSRQRRRAGHQEGAGHHPCG